MKLTENNIGILGFNYEPTISDCYSKKLEKITKNSEDSKQITVYIWFKGDSWAYNHVTVKEDCYSRDVITDTHEITIMDSISTLKPLVKLLLILEKYN